MASMLTQLRRDAPQMGPQLSGSDSVILNVSDLPLCSHYCKWQVSVVSVSKDEGAGAQRRDTGPVIAGLESGNPLGLYFIVHVCLYQQIPFLVLHREVLPEYECDTGIPS